MLPSSCGNVGQGGGTGHGTECSGRRTMGTRALKNPRDEILAAVRAYSIRANCFSLQTRGALLLLFLFPALLLNKVAMARSDILSRGKIAVVSEGDAWLDKHRFLKVS